MNENIYKELIKEAPIGYAYCQLIFNKEDEICDYKFLEVNPDFERILSIKKEEIIEKRITEISKKIGVSELVDMDFYKKFFADKKKKEFTCYSNVSHRWLQVKVYSFELPFFHMYILEGTKEKRKDLGIPKEQIPFFGIYSSLLDIVPTPVYYKDENAKYLGCNRAYERFFNVSREELVGKTVFEINPFEFASIFNEKDLELLRQIGTQTYESKVMDGNGMIHNMIFYKATVTDLKGNIIGLIGNILDITKQKIIEENLRESKEFYRLIFENTPLGVLHFDPEARITDCNDNLAKIIGSSHNYLIGFNLHSLQNEMVKKAVAETLKGNLSKYEGDYKSLTANKVTPVRAIFSPILSADNLVQGGIGIVEDITEQKRLEEALSNEKKLLETTLLSVGDGVISTDEEGNVIFLNKVAEDLTGWTQEEARKRSFEEVFQILDEDSEEIKENIVRKVLYQKKRVELSNHTILITKDKRRIPIENSAAPIVEEGGKIIGAVLVFRDVTERKERQSKILYLSYHDQLTGLYNRRFYEEELLRMDKKENLPITIVMGDVNGLKLINDSFGHAFGDELLQKVAKVILNGCRGSDIVARLGGDEFVILLPKTDANLARKIIHRIKEFGQKETVGSINISISFGYETKYKETQVVEEIFKKAEDRMYKKKLMESPSVRGKTMNAIISALYEKNGSEEQHSRRVSELCQNIGILLNLDESEIEELKTVGLLHDIGKIAIDERILNKPDVLTACERKEIERHSEIGYRILNTVNDMKEIAVGVLHHHERWDGMGYPKGLKETEIPFASRVVAIADAYDAMSSKRSYRDALSEEETIRELEKNAGKQFDPELVRIFLKMLI